jgi:hypothetical protein
MSLKGKLETINKVGTLPLLTGIKNKILSNSEVEKLAKKRSKICVGCDLMVKEPVDFMRVKDKKIPKVSEMMCGDCFCSIPLKIRQNKVICKKWL